jgi:hypothetical protein
MMMYNIFILFQKVYSLLFTIWEMGVKTLFPLFIKVQMQPETSTSKRNSSEVSNRYWWENVREKDRPLAHKIVNECDWSWTESIKKLPKEWVQQYQLFILCKIVAKDKRLFLSPSPEVDEVWHEHLKRPVSYGTMCQTLLSDNGKPTTELFMIDHTPESEEDDEEVKEERRERTNNYMDLLCSDWKEIMKYDNMNVPPPLGFNVTIRLKDCQRVFNRAGSL